ncbi:TonB-dependent receptor [Thalassotalea sp. HSM 43]|uniref:TonB-dependent receptor n=1 Tax=Thalassotalea sp. HSM 43 TaxID=2552945 RepID=UPI001081EF1C|nr:TonB-dependent receptor [Thalassotalea sp. HSM 43]QBY04476.1 TonB-dependent receptor [Thalassotalea sp. HSM 43]
MYNKKFKQSALAMSIATVLATSAYAQDATSDNEQEYDEAEQMEVIEVTGIKGVFLRSMDLKREAKGIVDGISAEDIGKFPDTNLAESLQRITGIAIERDRGEGSEITVRGFGPDFNLVTFNGRQMPTTGGRSFDFSNIASEGISAVEVYKSGRANVPTGGIGAVVNVVTSKPLQRPGLQAAFSAKGVHDKGTREGNDVTPEFAALFSDTFADDTFGIGLSFSYQERDGGWQSATTQDFMSRNFVSQAEVEAYELEFGEPHPDNEWGTIFVGDPKAIGFPTETVDGIYAVPTNIQYNLDDFHRERVNAQLTMQWKPIDSLVATIDYTYAENEIDTEHKDLSAWFEPSCSTRESEWVKEGNIYSPTRYSVVGCAVDRIQGVGRFATVDENNSLGVNFEWTPNDSLKVIADYHDSRGEQKPNSKYGSSGFVAVASLNRITTDGYFSADGMPILDIELGERNSNNQIIRVDELDVNDMQLSGSGFGSIDNQMDVEQLQISGEYVFDNGLTIEIGAARVEVDNAGRTAWVPRNAWSGLGEPGDIADLLSIESIDGVFDGIEGSNDPRMTTDYVTWDFDALIERGEQLLKSGYHGSVEGNGGPCLTNFCPTYNFDVDETTSEESNSFYIQGHYEMELFEMPLNIFVGIRYEDTEVHSKALVPLYDRIEWSVFSNGFDLYKQTNADGSSVQGFSEIKGDYDMWLPSIDIDYEVVENVIIRASYSQTISRPTYNDIKGALFVDWFGSGGGGGRRGNPQLLPMESTNLDFSFEWYFDEASYMSVGYWTKDVENFIVTKTFEDQPLFGNLTTPIEGDLYNQAIEDITGGDPFFEYTPEDVNAYFAEHFADEANVEVTGEGDEIEVVVTGLPTDPVATFDVNIPINQNETTVDGWEIAIQHTFGDTGFGVQANFTIVEGDLEYDINKNEDQWVVPGMSDTANLVAFYEKYGFQVRVAYNWRDDYLQSAGRDPRFVEEYYQWDANISYDINEHFSVFVEGINLTEEDQRIHGRSKYQVREYSVGHTRYNFGARYVF